MARLSGLAKDTPPATGLISAGQVTAECHVSEEKDITDMDYDVTATSSSTRICMDKASVSSSPRIQNEDFVDVCSVCAKPKRINTLPEIQNMISFCDRKCHPAKLSCSQDGPYGISRHEGQHEEQCHIVEEEETALDNHDNENNTCAKCEHGGHSENITVHLVLEVLCAISCTYNLRFSIPCSMGSCIHAVRSIFECTVYAGDKNVSNIQILEFYEDGGGVMLEVLLSTTEAILEDLDSLKHIDCWGVIVVDVFYGSKMSEYLEQIRNLS